MSTTPLLSLWHLPCLNFCRQVVVLSYTSLPGCSAWHLSPPPPYQKKVTANAKLFLCFCVYPNQENLNSFNTNRNSINKLYINYTSLKLLFYTRGVAEFLYKIREHVFSLNCVFREFEVTCSVHVPNSFRGKQNTAAVPMWSKMVSSAPFVNSL